MFQKGSFSIPSDSSGILLVKVIQTRRCSTKRHAGIGKFLRVVLRNAKTKLTKRLKRRVRSIVIRSQSYYSKIGGVFYQFGVNSLVLLKKRMNTFGKELYGPTSKKLKIRKFRIAFRYIYKVKFFSSIFLNILKQPSLKFYLNLFFLKYSVAFSYLQLNYPHLFLNTKYLKIKILNTKILNFFWKNLFFLVIVLFFLAFLFTVL